MIVKPGKSSEIWDQPNFSIRFSQARCQLSLLDKTGGSSEAARQVHHHCLDQSKEYQARHRLSCPPDTVSCVCQARNYFLKNFGKIWEFIKCPSKWQPLLFFFFVYKRHSSRAATLSPYFSPAYLVSHPHRIPAQKRWFETNSRTDRPTLLTINWMLPILNIDSGLGLVSLHASIDKNRGGESKYFF